MALFKKKVSASQAVEEEEDVNILKEIVGVILYIAVVVLLIFVIITYVGERTEVTGDSMNNTLTDGDNLWISKLSYEIGDPERFDIVVFPYQDSDTYFVKRVIGLPGETIYVDIHGNIYINDELLEEDYGNAPIDEAHIGRAAERITLGADEYFVMGDNRNNSMDSRDESVGNIPRSAIKGKAVIRMYPFDEFGSLYK